VNNKKTKTAVCISKLIRWFLNVKLSGNQGKNSVNIDGKKFDSPEMVEKYS